MSEKQETTGIQSEGTGTEDQAMQGHEPQPASEPEGENSQVTGAPVDKEAEEKTENVPEASHQNQEKAEDTSVKSATLNSRQEGEEKVFSDNTSSTGKDFEEEAVKNRLNNEIPDLNKDKNIEPEQKAEERTQDKEAPQIGVWGRLFNSFAGIGPIMLLVGLCALVWPDFLQEGYYCPAEVKPISAFLHCITQNSWLMPTALENGSFSLPQWPGFFWLLAALAYVPGLINSGYLLPAASTVSTCLALLGAWGLAHASHAGARAAFAAGLVLFCAPLFTPLSHFVGAPPLAAALILISLAFFARGWQKNHAFISIPLGFVFAGLAGVTGGWLFLALPFAASLCFLIWRGTIKRAQALDALFGFILLLAIYGVWLGFIMLGNSGDNDYLSKLFANTWTFEHVLKRWWVLCIPIVGTMPWILEIFGVSWLHVLGQSGKTLSESRKSNAFALIWISLVLAGCMTLVLPVPQYGAIMMVMLLTVLLGKAFVNMKPGGNRFFFLLASIAMILGGIALEAASFEASRNYLLNMVPVEIDPRVPQILSALSTLPIIGGVLILGGLFGFFFVRKYRGNGGLIYGSVITIIISNLFLFLLIPEIGNQPGSPIITMAEIQKQVDNASLPQSAPVSTPALIPTVPETPEQGTPGQPPVIPQMPSTIFPSPAQGQAVPAPEPVQSSQPESPAVTPEQAAPVQPDTGMERGQQPAATPPEGEPVIIIDELPQAVQPESSPATPAKPVPPAVEELKEITIVPEPEKPVLVVPVPEPAAPGEKGVN